MGGALPVSMLAIVCAIFIGWKKKMNAGIIAIVFAFFIQVFLLNGSINDVIAAWPSNIVFYLISISLFFNYATSNGTMNLLATKLLYRLNGKNYLIPWVITMVCALVAFLGAGASTPAIIGPLAFTIGLQAGIHPVLIALCVACATTIGGDNPINGYGGVISKGLIEQGAYATNATRISYYIWFNSILKQAIVIIGAFILFNGYKASEVKLEKPKAFNAIQKKQWILILASLLMMIIPMILNALFPIFIFKKLTTILQPQSVMIMASILCAWLNLGDQRQVVERISVNTILLIAGMSMLLHVAKEAGMVDAISSVMSEHIPKVMVPATLVGISAFLSFFSSGTGVVCPLLYPMVENLVNNMGFDPVMLFSCIFIGAMSSSVSPFSTGGAMTIAGCQDQEIKDQLTNWMIPVALVIPLLCSILASIGMFGLFHMG